MRLKRVFLRSQSVFKSFLSPMNGNTDRKKRCFLPQNRFRISSRHPKSRKKSSIHSRDSIALPGDRVNMTYSKPKTNCDSEKPSGIAAIKPYHSTERPRQRIAHLGDIIRTQQTQSTPQAKTAYNASKYRYQKRTQQDFFRGSGLNHALSGISG